MSYHIENYKTYLQGLDGRKYRSGNSSESADHQRAAQTVKRAGLGNSSVEDCTSSIKRYLEDWLQSCT